jgi:ankyrin repeat protein
MGEVDAVSHFLKSGADVNAKNHKGNTPLFDACWNGHADIVRLLLEYGADTTVVNKRGDTALDNAIALDDSFRNREEIIDLFREYGPGNGFGSLL